MDQTKFQIKITAKTHICSMMMLQIATVLF